MSGAGGYHQPDPTTIVAPPRADYDYSPLDLAPPGQRRRRQLVAAALGGLVMILLVGGIIFAFLLLRDDNDPDEDALTVAAAQTVVAENQAADGEDQTVAGESDADAATEPAGANDAEGEPTEASTEAPEEAESQSTAGDAAGEAIGPTPTPPAQNQNESVPAAGGLTEAELMAMLPDASVMPQGLDNVTESNRTQELVVDALGGSRDAANRLEQWGWSGNVERIFQPSDGAPVPQEATSFISVSLHGFANEQAAAEALPYYSDILLNIGYEEAPEVDIGSASRLMVMPQEDGGTEIALYIQDGAVLYRIGGYSLAGDPTLDVLSVASQTIRQ